MHNITDTAAAAPTFKTLSSALKATELDSTLKGKGPFTVFAPTDSAFEKLPPGTVDKLMKDLPKLKAILNYHVVEGKMLAADVTKMDGKDAKTVNGATFKISTKDGLKLNGTSQVTKSDTDCTNGVIHTIDTVIMPPN